MSRPKIAGLVDAHLDDLLGSGLTLETILVSQMHSGAPAEVEAILGYGAGPGLVIPYAAWNGRPPFARVKLDRPGRNRYRSPKGSTNRLYIPAVLDPRHLKDVTVPLYITEGEKKALRACQEGLACVALAGVWSWRTKAGAYRNGPGRPLSELDEIPVAGRTIYIVFDSDRATNRNIQHAEAEFARYFASRRAPAFRIPLPAGPGGAKVGLDDYLCAHSVETFCAIEPEMIVVASADSSPEGGSSSGPEPLRRSAVVENAATIAPESVTWLWPGRIAVGALTNVVGLPDQGKTLIVIDVAARVTMGSPMPPEPRQPDRLPRRRVLILTLEDSLSTTIVPRLITAGADLTRIDFIRMVQAPDGQTSFLTLAHDLNALAHALEAQPYALTVVDGITGYLGDAKTHNDAEVRSVLAPFVALLDRVRVAGISIMHPPKSVTNLAYFAGGSVAFTAVPRVTLGVAPDPEDESPSPRRLLMKLKGNLYGAVPTLAYTIEAETPADVPWIEWAPDAVYINVADVLDPVRESPEDRSTRRACEEWLRAHLADGPRPSKEVEEAAENSGFSKATLRRARQRVVDSVKTGRPGQTQRWEWVLRPPDTGGVR